MKKVANLYLEDFFAWGIWQKIRLTGIREITLEEIESFAHEVSEDAQALGFKFSANFSRDLTQQFLNDYDKYITFNKNSCFKSIKLNDNITYENCLDIFHMGGIPYELVKIMLSEKIGKKVFSKEFEKTKSAGTTKKMRGFKNCYVLPRKYEIKSREPIEDKFSL